MGLEFTRAICRTPCRRMVEGITTANLGPVNIELALVQHQAYVDTLANLGLRVTLLPADEAFPDSTFVEDVAVCTADLAVVTNPGASTRNGEKLEMEEVLKRQFESVNHIESPGTLDGGDVMMAGSRFFVGLSDRTNREGAHQLRDILAGNGLETTVVEFVDMLHLKSGLSYLENENLLATETMSKHPELEMFQTTVVDAAEVYAANSVWINGTVLVPAGFPRTRAAIESLGYSICELDLSEFRKLDGGLSCLSIRF